MQSKLSPRLTQLAKAARQLAGKHGHRLSRFDGCTWHRSVAADTRDGIPAAVAVCRSCKAVAAVYDHPHHALGGAAIVRACANA